MQDPVLSLLDRGMARFPRLAARKLAITVWLRWCAAAFFIYPMMDAAGRGVDSTDVMMLYGVLAVIAASAGLFLNHHRTSPRWLHMLEQGKNKAVWVLPRLGLSALVLYLAWLGVSFVLDGLLGTTAFAVATLTKFSLIFSVYLPAARAETRSAAHE